MEISSLYSCGDMMPISVDPNYPVLANVQKFCPMDWLDHPITENSSSGVKIMRSLPVDLRVSIAEATGWNASTFISKIDHSLSRLASSNGIRGCDEVLSKLATLNRLERRPQCHS
ncbi:hypothetical protein XA68_16866 [Ophiocordyceps unilateralis]|uniref:Uncharacterized protein n=1 Tax=Ophiocordyceps unilateralis TaxID=268505 RepID=A0A2A9PJD7_OPHUN|nr:hypothetical protein XA68_16866 [Ophiocordyceps unilateralis]